MSKHTPGPWEPLNDSGYSNAQVFIDGYYLDVPGEDRATRHANAHLIAAAPELLQALEACAEREYNGFEPDNQSAHYQRIMAAIRKAKGE
jgi:hypothetical protein